MNRGELQNLIHIQPRLIGRRMKLIYLYTCVRVLVYPENPGVTTTRLHGTPEPHRSENLGRVSRTTRIVIIIYFQFFLFLNAYYACTFRVVSGLRCRFITYYCYAYAYKSYKFNIVVTTIQQYSSMLYNKKKKTNYIKNFLNLVSAGYAFYSGVEGVEIQFITIDC